ncbi:MAG: AAA family ATPase [Planctomycetota bacterium]
MSTETLEAAGSLLAPLLSDEKFWPAPPRTVEETGLTSSMIESLVCKHLAIVGNNSGRGIAQHLCLPFVVLDGMLQTMRTRQIIVHTGSAPLNDYRYVLTEQGRQRAEAYAATCAYSGAAPVPLMDYVLSVEAQSIRAEAPRREQLSAAFADISVEPELFDALGPAVNSGAGLFLYGAPGNGKSTLAKRITKCFGQQIWVPHAVVEDNQLIKVYDAAYHLAIEEEENALAALDYDKRWVKIRRPTVIVGGELTLDGLEIRFDPNSRTSEAPLQMKSNCGCLLIDDFGRQRVEPAELLNRWIVPLENRVDYLTLSTGKKIQIPFEQLIIFSTNLEPSDLVDEAFLRRIPYKIEIGDASETEFHRLFQLYARKFGCEYRRDVVEHLVGQHYRPLGRPMRRCHPRDLLNQIRSYCAYHDVPMEMRPDYFDRVVRSYFTVVRGMEHPDSCAAPPPPAKQSLMAGRSTSAAADRADSRREASPAGRREATEPLPSPPSARGLDQSPGAVTVPIESVPAESG